MKDMSQQFRVLTRNASAGICLVFVRIHRTITVSHSNKRSIRVHSDVARMELFLRTPRKNLDKSSKIWATLRGKNLLPEGANSFR